MSDPTKQHPEGLRLFLDLDGVLADFDRAAHAILGAPPDAVEPNVMWRRIAGAPDFFGTLPLMPDALELWRFAAPYSPTILTGSPRGDWAEPQKRRWVKQHLGPDVPVIVCLARDKGRFGGANAVLVDDMEKNAPGWRLAGGTFVRHTSAAASISHLRRLGFH